jgi:hypothetical protein
MLARLTSRKPAKPANVFDVPEHIPWATPFPPGSQLPARYQLLPGNYTIRGRISGAADVVLGEDPTAAGRIGSVSVTYANYSDERGYVVNGHEQVSLEILLPDVWNNLVHWYSDLVQTGVVQATKKTSPGGLHLQINAMTNILQANGTLTTTIDGIEYKQPANGT